MNFSAIKTIRLRDNMLAPWQRTGLETTIPRCLEHCQTTGRLKAFELKYRPGDPDTPHIYWDSDVAKVMEGMAEALILRPDPELESRLNQLVELVLGAQQKDGYLNTYFTVVEPEKRWSCLSKNHELYCAGHLMEAAVAHFEATGSRRFLDAMCRYADHIARTFGRAPGQKRGYPGHEEIELALVRLYRATGKKRYLDLARYFIEERGTEPNYYVARENFPREKLSNLQADKPVMEQSEAEGHAVRAIYLYRAMLDLAVETQDRKMLEKVKQLFRNITRRRMYITGGIGSTQRGEAFTHDYALPNDTAYAESCAAIGLIFLAKRLLDITGECEYADVMERVLYNNGLSGISLDGGEFFYANPLEVNRTTMELMNTGRIRQKWFGCSCCPTSYCRFLPQLGSFCAAAAPSELRIDIPAAAVISTPDYEVEVAGDYPYCGDIRITVRRGGHFELAARIPGWCKHYRAKLNGRDCGNAVINGYWRLTREWKNSDVLELTLAMNPELVFASPRVPADAGRAALQRGPLVYCIESADNPGVTLHSAVIPRVPDFRLEEATGLPAGTVAIRFRGKIEITDSDTLYRSSPPEYTDGKLCAIPYALWQNRGAGDMQVFMLYER